MANFGGIILTNAGRNLLAKAMSGEQLQFTKVTIGDGIWDSNINSETLTSLISPKLDVPIQRIESYNEEVKLRIAINNENITEGFFLREIGIYANDPQDGEILYAVSYASNPDFIPSAFTTKTEITIDFYIAVSNTQNVTAVISDTVVLATREDINKHNTDSTAHADIRNLITDLQNGKANIDLSNITSLGNILNLDGSDSGLDADTVDGKHASDLANVNLNNITSLGNILNLDGSGSGLDADLLDGKHASDFANVNLSNVDTNIFKNFVNNIQGINADTVDNFHASQTPQANTIPVANSDGKIAGDWYIVAQSLGTNGYVKFSNGLIIQWGRFTASASNGSVTLSSITFPISFPNDITGTYACVETSVSSSGYLAIISIRNKSVSGMTIALDSNGHANFTQTQTGTWLAIGY